MLIGQPLFPGESGVDQLVEIMKVLGSPNPEQIHKMNQNYNDEFDFPPVGQRQWKEILNKNYDNEFLKQSQNLLQMCIVYDPTKRVKPL